MKQRQILICPVPDLKIEVAVPIVTVVSVFDLATMVADETTVAVAFSEMRVLECFTKYPDLFDVKIVVLVGVPGADYTPAFEQLAWSYDKVSYDTLLVEASTVQRMEQLKKDERPKPQGMSRDLPSREDVLKAKIPSAINWVKDPAGSTEE